MMGRDSELIHFASAIVNAAQTEFGDQPVMDPDPKNFYTETHFALSALLLYLLDNNKYPLLNVAEQRLRIFHGANPTPTFFNAFAVCLAATIVRQAGIKHVGLNSILENLLAKTHESRYAAYKRYCGNNMYLQQVAIDNILLPIAREKPVTKENVSFLITEFKKYQTKEGFYYDLPRSGTQQERLCPPTYIMKMLFLAGVCHKLHPKENIAELFLPSISATLPLLTDEGNFSYFGRTDNSPFAAGLTVYNFRQAAYLCPEQSNIFHDAGRRAEVYYRTFPKTASGLLQCNRFADFRSQQELNYSRDDYAYIGQYSLSSCAYALLGCYWFKTHDEVKAAFLPKREILPTSSESKDLGLVKLSGPGYELILRTGSEITSWDRRYLGPTILRYKRNNRLLIGAISLTLTTDLAVRADRSANRLKRAFENGRHLFRNGWEMLDGTSVGFLPVLRDGFSDYLPSKAFYIETSQSFVHSRHNVTRVQSRWLHPCFTQYVNLIRKISRLKPRMYTRPAMNPVDSIEFSRVIHLEDNKFHVEDCICGDLKNKKLIFSVRCFPQTLIEIQGLHQRESITGWGSDGRQELRLYEAQRLGNKFRYQFTVEALP